MGPSMSSKRSTRPPAVRGFTLVELMVTVAVLAIVLAVAIPGFRGLIHRNRLTSATNEIVATLQLARMEAIRRNSRVQICPSTDGTGCAGSDWSRMVVRVVADGTIVRDIAIDGDGLQVAASDNVTSDDTIAFAADGLARVGSGNDREGALSVCSTRLPDADNVRDIALAVSRVSVVSRSDAACGAPED